MMMKRVHIHIYVKERSKEGVTTTPLDDDDARAPRLLSRTRRRNSAFRFSRRRFLSRLNVPFESSRVTGPTCLGCARRRGGDSGSLDKERGVF